MEEDFPVVPKLTARLTDHLGHGISSVRLYPAHISPLRLYDRRSASTVSFWMIGCETPYTGVQVALAASEHEVDTGSVPATCMGNQY